MTDVKKYKTRKLDDNGDASFSGTVWIYNNEAIAQTIKTRIKLFTGEWWRDASEGTPWKTKILGKNNQSQTLASKEAILKSRILQTAGVISILRWESDFDYAKRVLSVTCTVLTEFGDLTVNV